MVMDIEAIKHIKQLKARYFRAVDRADQKLLHRCFREEATVGFEGENYVIKLNCIDEITGLLHYP